MALWQFFGRRKSPKTPGTTHPWAQSKTQADVETVVFQCPTGRCGQQLRIPVLPHDLVIRCPQCKGSYSNTEIADELFDRGIARSGQGDLRGALECLTQCIAIRNRDNAEDMFFMGTTLTKMQEYSQARPYLQKAAEMGSPGAQHWLGLTLFHMGQYQESVAALRRAREESGTIPNQITVYWLERAEAALGGKVQAQKPETQYSRVRCSPSVELLLDGSGVIAGMWLNDGLGAETSTDLLKMVLSDGRISLHKDVVLAAYIDVSIDNYRKVKSGDAPGGGYFVMLAGHLAPGERPPSARETVWTRGEANPCVGELTLHQDSGLLRYSCFTCKAPMTLFQKDIQPEGLTVDCSVCGAFTHLYGDYATWNGRGTIQPVCGSVYVPIKDFSQWYLSHPVFLAMQANGKSRYLHHYGQWAVCPGCKLQYMSTVLASFALMQQSESMSGVFMAHSAQSGEQMKSLLDRAQCPRCGDLGLLALMVEVPGSVEEHLQRLKT